MSRSPNHIRSAAWLLAALLAMAGTVWAQSEESGDFANDELAPSDVETGSIDAILEGEEQMLQGSGYFYEPGERRDPFRSLLAARFRPRQRGPRSEGIPGLLIDEVDLTGIFVTGDGPVAQIESTDREKSFLLRIGDQLFDGDVVSIVRGQVTFRQIVDDPTAIKPFREVIKKLNP